MFKLTRTRASWLAKKKTHNTPGMHFWAIFTHKTGIITWENDHIGKNNQTYALQYVLVSYPTDIIIILISQ